MKTPHGFTKPMPAEEILRHVLDIDRRVLLVGPPGSGKSTLMNTLATGLAQAGRRCTGIAADPGSPLFGVPGAVSLAQRTASGWEHMRMEALCTLDAGRFRLPVVAAVGRLAAEITDGVLLVDSPGVVRGVGAAELIPSLAEAMAADQVLVLMRPGDPLPLAEELAALPVPTYTVLAATAAHRPSKTIRAQQRTRLWEHYLSSGTESRLSLTSLPVLGTPPPRPVPHAWVGRQCALLAGHRTLALGEIRALEKTTLRVHMPAVRETATALRVRDAQRRTDGYLGTAEPVSAPEPEYLTPTEPRPAPTAASTGERPVTIRVGIAAVTLVNGIFGDPLLHLRLRHQRRSLLFDLGEGTRLSARVAHQVSDVFISHTHIDHIAGFLWLLRSRIGAFPPCRLYGPPGLAANVAGLMQGILWDRINDRGPCFTVHELHENRLLTFGVQAGRPNFQQHAERSVTEGLLWTESGFRVRATTLDHGSPVLAFAFEPTTELQVRKDRLRARGWAPGPWLGTLKRCVQDQQHDELIPLPDGRVATAGELADELLRVSAGKTLVYATDFADSPDNRQRLVTLARGAHTLFCEASFCLVDASQAQRTAHLTTRSCAEIAEAAGVLRLIPFHFSRRYEDAPERVYEEIAQFCARLVFPSH